MKKVLFLILILCLPLIANSQGLVTATITRDTLSLPFIAIDSGGNNKALSTGDSVILLVRAPGGTVVYVDSTTYDDANVKSEGTLYSYTERVSVLDGSSTTLGVFTWYIKAVDHTDADLRTVSSGQFQKIGTSLTYDSIVDSLIAVSDSLQFMVDSLMDRSIEKNYFGISPNNKVIKHSNGNVDTLVYMNNTDSLTRVLYYHIGGASGDAPDSIKILLVE